MLMGTLPSYHGMFHTDTPAKLFIPDSEDIPAAKEDLRCQVQLYHDSPALNMVSEFTGKSGDNNLVSLELGSFPAF